MDERNEIENDVKVDAVTSKGRKAVIILISLLILYTLYHVCMGLTESVKTTPAGLVEQSSSVVFEGVIYRNEEVISTKNKGDMRPYFYDGERVSVDSLVAAVYSSSVKGDVIEKISEFEEKLDILKKSNVRGLVSIVDIEKTKKEIDTLYTSMMLALSDGDLLRAHRAEKEMLIAMNKLGIYEGRVSNYNAEISSTEALLDELYNSFKGEPEYIYADRGGYFYHSCDGYEKILTLGSLPSLTYKSLADTVKAVKEKPIAKNAGLCKFVYGNVWSIAVPCNNETADMLEVGKSYDVTLFDVRERDLIFTLESIKRDENGCVLVFTCPDMPEGFEFARYQSFRLDISSIEGYRVPKEALVSMTDKSTGEVEHGVYILEASVVYYKQVDVIAESEGYYIVAKYDKNRENHNEYLNINDMVILETRGMYDGKVLTR